MLVWAQKRRFVISTIVLVPLLAVIIFIYISSREAPNCFDGKLNQNERGIDCGGMCVAVCQNEATDVAILWTRFIPIINDVYSVVAMVENPNINFEAKGAPYIFRLYDEENLLIYERKGRAFIPSGYTFPIFEHALKVGERIPSRATFEFNIPPLWENTSQEKIQIRIVSKNLDEDSSFPRVVSVVKNTSLKTLTNISFIALLFDEDENLINASKTVLDKLAREESDTLVFTWPQNLTSVVAKIEIIPVEYTVNN